MTQPTLSIRTRFANSARANARRNDDRTPEEWERQGLLAFSKRVFGIWEVLTMQYRVVKPVSTLAGILTELKVVDSIEQGRQVIQDSYGHPLEYGDRGLILGRATNHDGQEICEVIRYHNSPEPDGFLD